MKNNQPQLHVTSTLIAQESITLNVISMNTKRIHTRWLVLVKRSRQWLWQGFGWASCQPSSRRLCRVSASPVSLGSWALMPQLVILLQALEVKVQLLNRGKKSNKRQPASVLKPIGSTERCLFAPSSCGRVAQVKVAYAALPPASPAGKAKNQC